MPRHGDLATTLLTPDGLGGGGLGAETAAAPGALSTRPRRDGANQDVEHGLPVDTEAHLAPAAGGAQRKALAKELQRVLRRCADEYGRLDQHERGQQRGAAVADCRAASERLCCDTSTRPGALAVSRALEERCGKRGVVAVAVAVAVLLPAMAMELWLQPLVSACCDSQGSCSGDQYSYPATCWRAAPPMLFFALFAVVFGLLFAIQWDSMATLTVERLRRSMSCSGPGSAAAPADSNTSGEDVLPVYLDKPDRLTFGSLVTATGTLVSGESCADLDEDLVTLPMFLLRCLTLCIPRSTAGEQHLFDLD